MSINDEKLFKQYAILKAIILNIDEVSLINFLDKPIQHKIILQYKEFVLNSTHGIYPLFLFSKYDEKKFRKCLNYLIQGHSLLETDNFFINGCKDTKSKEKKL